MGFEQEALDELIEHMRGRGAAMQERLTHSTKGEPLVLHELAVHGTRTPSQLAAAADTTSGRTSAVRGKLYLGLCASSLCFSFELRLDEPLKNLFIIF